MTEAMASAAPAGDYGAILAREAAARRRRALLWTAVIAACALSLAMTGFFDARRFFEGTPALAQLASEMVPPHFERWQAWIRPLADTLAMSIAGTALAVVLSLPLAVASRHLIGPSTLPRCKPGMFLINVGRGSLVDEAAVAQALQNETLGGYAADVFEFEDRAFVGRPARVTAALLRAPNTLFTPHLGSAVREVRRAIEHRAADNVLAALSGEPPPDAINVPRRTTPAQAPVF